MVKFSEQLEMQLVPEWRGAYCQYNLLKKDLKKIRLNQRIGMPIDPASVAPASPFNFHKCAHRSLRYHSNLIQVHCRKSDMGDELVYETELFGQIAQSDYDRRFFASLDSQFNKVNEFYRNKEEEFVQYEMLLEKQIFALTGVKKLLKQKQILMEAQQYSYLDKNDELIDSIAKATLAATSVTGVPWRRRTMDSWELAFGSNAGLIPSEVAAGTLLTRASMYGSQIRWSIPQSASMAMISAISEMLWEDVFCQSKRLMTDYIGQEDIAFSQKKVQSAADMLRVAFIDFYRGLGMLKSFSSLNMAAFAKILQKYEKVTGLFIAQSYMHHVDCAYINSSEKISQLMGKVEVTFAEHFTSGNQRQAMAALRPIHQTAPHSLTYLLGFFTGCSLMLILAFGCILQLDGDYRKMKYLTYLQTIFPTFSLVALVLIHVYMYGWNLYMWKRVHINYTFIFEFSPGSELHCEEVLLVCTALTTVLIGAMVMHLSIHSMLFHAQASAYVDLIPVAVMLVFLVLLFNPLNLCYRSSRFFFLRVWQHVICAPFYKVGLADFFLADQLTSQVSTLRNFEFVLCYYGGGHFLTMNSNACTNSACFKNWTFVLALLPYWWRFWQCMRRWADESDTIHLANAGKYLSAAAALALRIVYNLNPGVAWLTIFFIVSSIATIYQVYWDVVVDWGLLHPNSQNPWLRDQLLLDHKSIYFASMVLNLLLRLSWLQSIPHLRIGGVDGYVTDFLFASLEILRRGQWNFYRLENEHLNNVGHYRAIKTVPLPFEDASSVN
ncbi:unnamed protein product [Sphagnum compactum]